MSNNLNASNVPYNALPVANDDNPAFYNNASGEDLRLQTYHTPRTNPTELSPEDDSPTAMPAGAAQPRFLGAPGYRDSYASSQYSYPAAPSEYNGSLYALDPSGAAGMTGSFRDDPRGSYLPMEHGAVPLSPVSPREGHRFLTEKGTAYASPKSKSKRKVMIYAVIAAVVLLILAIFIPVYVFVVKPNTRTSFSHSGSSSGSSSASPSSASNPGKGSVAAVTGGDGSTVTMEDGTTFTYKNSFGGYWYYDESNPFSNAAKSQSWNPALNDTFRYGIDKIRGVNFGGWLLTEPFIAPALYQKYPHTVDEWTLSQAMRADTAGGGINQLEEHYKTFITEKDFAEVAAAGLNFIRLPIGYWAIETRDGEQFLPKVSWTYFLKAVKWARKYGLRINLDLHALPGSQNGWNHSGRLGTVGFLNGPMGYANAQRSLDYIRIISEFISQPQYKDVVTMFGVVNEPQGGTFGKDQLASFYLQAYNIIRTAGGTGEGKGPYVSIHDGFFARSDWVNIFPNADRMSIDTHPYLSFGPQSSSPMASFVNTPCSSWSNLVNTSMGAFGLTTAGEWSNAVTDCGLFLNNVGEGTRYEGTYSQGVWPRIGSCTPWTDWQNYSDDMKKSIRRFALSSMDALQDYFFWTWKIGNSSESGKVETPAWSYQLGLQNGWMPTDPRDAIGACSNTSPWAPPLEAWQTGGAGAGNMPDSVSANYPWPPKSISQAGAVSTLPFYTPTGPIPTLPAPTFSASKATKSVDPGSGWNNPADQQGLHVPIPTCSYLDPWVDPGTAPPASCGPAVARRVADPLITPPPST